MKAHFLFLHSLALDGVFEVFLRGWTSSIE